MNAVTVASLAVPLGVLLIALGYLEALLLAGQSIDPAARFKDPSEPARFELRSATLRMRLRRLRWSSTAQGALARLVGTRVKQRVSDQFGAIHAALGGLG